MSDIKMLNLYRGSSTEDFYVNKDEKKSVNYFVTDYFDSIRVEDMDQESVTFMECMGIKKEANIKKGVSHQRYCLYSSDDSKSNIFDKMDDYPVLMVVQLFINPNVFQASSFSDGKELSGKNWIEKLDCFIKKHVTDSDAKWKTYQLLTAGDFAVVIRCSKIHKAYDICTLIRSIRLVAEGKNVDEAAFFSYSICGVIDGEANEGDEPSPVCWKEYLEPEDRIVVRIRYKQEFRNQLDQDIDLKKGLLTKGAHLIGRYDHQMTLTPEEFQQLYPFLRQYKLENKKTDETIPKTVGVTDQVSILLKMMEKRYISYVNERLLLNYDEDSCLEGSHAEKWMLICRKEWRRLHTVNACKIERIKGKVSDIEEKMDPYYQSARNLKEYLRLAGRLCRVLNELNKLKELRISVANALQQYETLIDSFERYMDQISEGIPKDFANVIEENLQYGIRALEIFVRYIRNVNPQAFQTPNYDLQTNVCMEKVLLAYSQFLKPYMMKQDEQNAPYRLPKTLNPIIVPSMGVRDLSVAVPFNNSVPRASKDNTQKLMIVYCPTFSFLCETCLLVPAVFHEIAHQFRYEERKIRNQCLEEYILKTFLHGILIDILDKQNEYDVAESSIVQEMVNKIYDEVFSCLVEDNYKEGCLMSFEDCLSERLGNFCESAQRMDRNQQEEVSRYLKKTKNSIRKYDSKILDIIQKIGTCLQDIDAVEKKIMESWKEEPKEEKFREEEIRKRADLQRILMALVENLRTCQEEQIVQAIKTNLEASKEEKLKEAKAKKLQKEEEKKLIEKEEKLLAGFDAIWNGTSGSYNHSMERVRDMFTLWNGEEGIEDKRGIFREKIIYLLKQYHNIQTAYSYFVHYAEEDMKEGVLKQKLRYRELFEHLRKILHEKLEPCLNKLRKERQECLDWNTPAVSDAKISDLMKILRIEKEEDMGSTLCNILQKHSKTAVSEFVSQKVNLYREVTSDLFMCAVMNLDGFGYLTVAAVVLKFDQLNQKALLERVSFVLECIYAEKLANKTLETMEYHRVLRERLLKEIEILHKGIHETAKKNKSTGKYLKNWPEDYEFKDPGEIDGFLKACLEESGFTSTQKWIIRVYRQITAIVQNVLINETNRVTIGRKEMWEDITQNDAYYFKKELRDLPDENGDNGLCESIMEILNSPASFFVKRKAILHQEIEFILSQYERSCRNIFKG